MSAGRGREITDGGAGPTEEEADRFTGYWHAWGDHLPLEVIVSPHRAVVAPLVNYLWALYRSAPADSKFRLIKVLTKSREGRPDPEPASGGKS
jgi:hypothetical protein